MKRRNRNQCLLLLTINWNTFALNFVLKDEADVAEYCHLQILPPQVYKTIKITFLQPSKMCKCTAWVKNTQSISLLIK